MTKLTDSQAKVLAKIAASGDAGHPDKGLNGNTTYALVKKGLARTVVTGTATRICRVTRQRLTRKTFVWVLTAAGRAAIAM